MLSADNVTSLTTEDILKHYKGTGYLPASVSVYNKIAREQLLLMKEMLAITVYMAEKQLVSADLIPMWEKLVVPVQNYVENLEKHIGANHNIHRAAKERNVPNQGYPTTE